MPETGELMERNSGIGRAVYGTARNACPEQSVGTSPLET
jgi:hypothetical protein